MLGAIMCWSDNLTGPGHVAVVEEISANGQIRYSQSSWTGAKFSYIGWVTPPQVGAKSTYVSNGVTITRTFQGYIYVIPYAAPTLSSVSIATLPSKINYTQGETLNTTGLALTARYSDNSTKAITGGFSCSPTILNTVGTQTINVTYEGKTASFTVTVATPSAPGTGIVWGDWSPWSTTVPASVPNRESESRKTTIGYNMVIYITQETASPNYRNFRSFSVNGNYAAYGLRSSYGEHCYRLYVTKATFDSAVRYYEGAYISVGVTGYHRGIGQAYYFNDAGNIWFIESESAITEYRYRDGTPVTPPPTLSLISISALPTKTTYSLGEMLNTTGLTLTAKYSDNSTKALSSGFSCSPSILNSVGTQTITVSYSEGGIVKTASFTVTVNPAPVLLEGIAITANQGKVVYTKGETLSLAGLTVTASYSDGSTKAVSGFTTSPANGAILNTTGMQIVTVSYAEGGIVKTTNFAVTVNPAPVSFVGIAITANPGKTVYTVGEALDLAGLTVAALYSDGSSKTVAGFTTSLSNGTILSSAGVQTVTVSYSEGGSAKTASFTVTVDRGISPGVTLVSIIPSASVKKLNGNQNELTITVTELYSDMSSKSNTTTILINNNSAGTYKVGDRKVYVDTKSNTQITACYIVE